MRTNHVSILLPDYLRGVLSSDESKEVEQHLQHCAACQSDLAEMKQVLAAIGAPPTLDVPGNYFSSLLPRIHQRLEKKKQSVWVSSPLVGKLVLPLGAALVVAVLLWHLPVQENAGRSTDPLLAVVDSAATVDIADIVKSDIPSHDMNSFSAMVLSHAMTDDDFVRRQLLDEALASDASSPFDVYANVTPVQALSGFSEAETNALLQKLDRMGTL